MNRLGVLGTMVWDTIYGRDPASGAVEEWGGVAYALAAVTAALPAGWEVVPLAKVGRDLVGPANAFLRSLDRTVPDGRFVEVPEPNNRVTLHYESATRRCEHLAGGVPPWSWPEIGPMVADLDALYVNFISGYEMSLETAQSLRRGFRGLIYADLHSLLLGTEADGRRILQPLPDAVEWFSCFNVVQVNEDEMLQITGDPLSLAAMAMGRGTELMVITLGPRGAVYVAAPSDPGGPVRTRLVEAPRVTGLDPTGCGDVFGGTLVCELLRRTHTEAAIARANAAAARNVLYRGATGLHRYLRGQLATP